MMFKIGDRVSYQYGLLKGTIREIDPVPTVQPSGLLPRSVSFRYRLDWDYTEMPPSMWVPGWQLHLIPDLEQLAEAAE